MELQMNLPDLALDSVTVVIRGNFNPALLSSAWMLTRGLIVAEDAVEAKQQIVTPETASFETSWFKFFANREIIQITTEESEEFERVRDLAVGGLKSLPDTPIGVMGINRDVHFTVSSKTEWHAIGDRLAPKAMWREILKDPGMNTLAISALRSDEYSGSIQVIVQPSARFPLGVFVSHNDHYSLLTDEQRLTSRDQLAEHMGRPVDPKPEKARIAIEVLNDMWTDSMTRATSVINKIAEQVKVA
jgi:hypothetical protein